MPSEEDPDEMSRWLRDHKRVSYTAWLLLEYALGWIIAAQEAIEARQIAALHGTCRHAKARRYEREHAGAPAPGIVKASLAALDDPAFLAERRRVREAIETLQERYQALEEEFIRRASLAWQQPTAR